MTHETILVIDDHALFRSGMVSMLSTAVDDVFITESASVEEALATVTCPPTMVLLDIQLPGLSGLDGMRSLRQRWPAARIVIVSALDLPDTIDAALSQGAVAFLSKTDQPEQMMAVLRKMLAESCSQLDRDTGGRTLTPRQTEVLDLVGQGLSNKMIGRRLGLSEHTVRGHVQAFLAVLGVARRAEAVFKARQLGMIR